jgi:hypothetical protein
MKVWGIPADEIDKVVTNVSKMFDSNVRYKRDPERDGRAVSFTLTVVDSKKKGSRVSPSGRRVAAACWHVHREVMWGILAYNNECRIKTAFADYRGLDDFTDKFGATGCVNIGSQMEPMNFEDACNCGMWESINEEVAA